MDSSVPPKPSVPDVQLLPLWRADAAPDGPKAAGPEAAPKAPEELSLKLETPQLTKVLVRIDGQSGRFVQTLLDRSTQEVLLQYPNEGQLAFSRAISAYVRASRDDPA